LLDAAEQLWGREGLQVSVNRIVSAAGQRNPSAVRLHFGGRDGLLDAVLGRGAATIDAAHRDLALSGGHRGTGRLADDLVAPFCHEAGSAYLSLLAQHLARPDTEPGAFGELFPTAAMTIAALVDRQELPDGPRQARIEMVAHLVVHATAQAEPPAPRPIADAVVALAAGRPEVTPDAERSVW